VQEFVGRRNYYVWEKIYAIIYLKKSKEMPVQLFGFLILFT